MTLTDWQLRQQIVETARRVYDRGFVAATDGNISARVRPTISGDRFLVTPSGCCLGELKPNDLVCIDAGGRRLVGAEQPTSELALHLEVYARRPDVHAAIHAHPPTVNGFSLAGQSLADPAIPEVFVALGSVPTAPYATPSTPEGAVAIRELIRTHDAIVLERHGSLTIGSTLLEAYHKLEKLEHAARILLTARLLGQVRTLSDDEQQRLLALRSKVGIRLPGTSDSVRSIPRAAGGY